MTDLELRDKLANDYCAHDINRDRSSFRLGWDARQFQVDELKAEVERLKSTANGCADGMITVAKDLAETWAERDRLKTMCEKLAEALEFYANMDNWEVSAIDDLVTVKTKLTKDKEAFGESEQPGLASKLTYYGGLRARQALAEYLNWKNEPKQLNKKELKNEKSK